MSKWKDPRWQKVRLEVFQRDNWTCTNCSDKENPLAVHHLRYEDFEKPWDCPLEDLRTLCEECHGIEFKHRKATEEWLIKGMRTSGFYCADIDMLRYIFEEFIYRKFNPRRRKLSPKDIIILLYKALYPKIGADRIKEHVDEAYPTTLRGYVYRPEDKECQKT